MSARTIYNNVGDAVSASAMKEAESMTPVAIISRFLASPVLTVVIAAILLATPAVHAGEVSFVQVGPSANCPDTVAVRVVLDGNVRDLHGFSFVLHYDSTLLHPFAVGAGSLVSGAPCPNFFSWRNNPAHGDSIWVDAFTLGCSVNGPGPVVQILFQGLREGASSIECRRGTMRNSQNQEMPFTCVPANVEYFCVTQVETLHWGMIKNIFR